MCDPVSVALGATVAGTAVSAAGQYQAGVAAQKTSNANARQLEIRAAEIREKEKFEIAQLKRDFERKQGANRARIAGSGMNEATFFDVLYDDAAESYLERKAVSWNADSEVRGLEYQASAERASGANAKTASYFNIGSTVLGGVTQGVTMRSQFATSGVSLGTSDRGVSLK